jgi:hypothetical protein
MLMGIPERRVGERKIVELRRGRTERKVWTGVCWVWDVLWVLRGGTGWRRAGVSSIVRENPTDGLKLGRIREARLHVLIFRARHADIRRVMGDINRRRSVALALRTLVLVLATAIIAILIRLRTLCLELDLLY